MITTFWSGLAGKLADRTALVLFSPASTFWLIGFLAWAQPHPIVRLRSLATEVSGQPQLIQWILIVAALAVLLASGIVAERLIPAALQVMQGDWPRALRPVRQLLVRRQFRIKEELETRWERLYSQVAESAVDTGNPVVEPARARTSAGAEEELLAIERRLSGYPPRSQRVAPTRLGNTLRSADARVLEKYGLDSARCWPALWLVVPDIVREQVGAARKGMDAAVLWWIWSVLLAVWLVLDLRVIVLVVVSSVLAYRGTVSAAAQYGELIDAAYTVHRGLLYDAAGWPRPQAADGDEAAWGRALTTSFWRGPALANRPSSEGGV